MTDEMDSNHRILLASNLGIVAKLVQKDTEIKVFHLMVKWLKETEIKGQKGMDSSAEKWEKVSKNFSLFGISSKKYSADKCHQIFYNWSKFYAQNYDYLNGNLDQKLAEIFDLMKIVHILDLTQFWSSYDWTHCLLKQISDKIEIKDYLNDLKKTNHLKSTPTKSERKSRGDAKLFYLKKMSAKLISESEDIQVFNLMVQIMESKTVYTKNGIIKWENISKNVVSFGYSSETYSHIKCREKFYYWSEFYCQSYNELEGKLESESQNVFDWLKIVHILDVTKLWRSEDPNLYLLKVISSQLNPYLSFKRVDKQRKPSPQMSTDNKTSVDGVGAKSHKNKDNLSEESKNNYKTMKKEFKQLGKERRTLPQNKNNENEVILNFNDMNLCKELLRGIYAYGLEKPSPIQQRAIVPCIEGRDVLAQAQSGTGKTASFVISILDLVEISLKECQALILAPTRELAQQIQRVVMDLAKYMNIVCHVCIGGTSVRLDVRRLQSEVHVVVGTVGRVCDLIKRNALRLEYLKVLVLDESDHMLDLSQSRNGFSHQILEIIKILNPKIQLFFSSATMPPEIMRVSKWLMRSPVRVLVKNEELTLEGIKQFYVSVDKEELKLDVFCDLYKSLSKSHTFVYCNTRERVNGLNDQLLLRNITLAHIHGELPQREREDILRGFRLGINRVLLTSDLLGRGIDVQQVSLVINYDLPQNVENYIHRVGRSGRFGRKGMAITLVTNNEMESLRELEKFYNTNIEEMPTDLLK